MRSFALLPLALTTLAVPMVAQGPSISARQAAGVRGTVYDSLVTGKVLTDAEVYIEGTNYVTRSDGRGQYHFDNLKPGHYVLGFSHLALDSLHLTAPTKPIDIPAGGVLLVALTTPSMGTLHVRACGKPMPEKAGLVLGVVKDADGDSTVSGVDVTAQWTATVLQRGLRPQSMEQTSHATTDASGRYILCGVPTDVSVALRTSVAGLTASLVQLDLADQGITLRNLTISLADLKTARATGTTSGADTTTALALTGTAKLTGQIRGEGGTPLAEAEVRVLGAATPKTTSLTDGSFALSGLPAGSQTLEIKALGYAPYRSWTDLRRDATSTLDIQLTKVAVVLNPVNVQGYSTLFDRSGFELRRQSGLGHYITDEDIRARNAIKLEDVFRGEPSVRLLPIGLNGYAIIFARAQNQNIANGGGDCYPKFWVDGSPFNPGDQDISNGLPIVPSDVKGIELYPSPSSTPPQFSTLDAACGTVVIWTKRGAPNRTFR